MKGGGVGPAGLLLSPPRCGYFPATARSKKDVTANTPVAAEPTGRNKRDEPTNCGLEAVFRPGQLRPRFHGLNNEKLASNNKKLLGAGNGFTTFTRRAPSGCELSREEFWLDGVLVERLGHVADKMPTIWHRSQGLETPSAP